MSSKNITPTACVNVSICAKKIKKLDKMELYCYRPRPAVVNNIN